MTWLLSREEREQYVIQLYKENKSVREIAKLTHMSFRDIGAITKKVKSEVELERGHLEEDGDIKLKSKTTQAIKLFCEGKNTVDVVIALDLPADEVRAIYREYWELKQMYELGQIYDEAEYDLRSLLRLHRIFGLKRWSTPFLTPSHRSLGIFFPWLGKKRLMNFSTFSVASYSDPDDLAVVLRII